jgi:hypothetical protein
MFPSTECLGYKRYALRERQNTFVYAFDPKIPRIYAYEIHEGIYETYLRESIDFMIQIDGKKRHVFIKLSDP